MATRRAKAAVKGKGAANVPKVRRRHVARKANTKELKVLVIHGARIYLTEGIVVAAIRASSGELIVIANGP